MGIRLLDLRHMLAEPYAAAMILPDLGCNTVRVEPPGCCEETRRLLENDSRHSLQGMGTYFFTLNRNKRSVAIDMKQPDGLVFFYDLVREADVVLDNFSAPVTSGPPSTRSSKDSAAVCRSLVSTPANSCGPTFRSATSAAACLR